MKLRDYQLDILQQIQSSATNDLVQLDTGAGKTPIEAALAAWAPRVLLVAHRNILIEQISDKLAAFGVLHDTISTEHTRRRCIAAHRRRGLDGIVRGHTTHLVASVQSLISARKRGTIKLDTSQPWLVIIDEAHHVVPDNMWGSIRELMPRARIVGFTATPMRMDGQSLHVDDGGLFDRLVQARGLGDDSARILIERGYLCRFRAFLPNSLATFTRGQKKGLDWDLGELKLAADPVDEYLRLARGSRAIVMAPAIKNAEAMALDFRAQGVPAACINSTQTPRQIARLIDLFRRGQIRVLTNVDMIGEGFDLPACDTLIIATRTASFPRYRQWCGRVLRPDTGKTFATIIDLAGMVGVHGMPDAPVKWDLRHPPVAAYGKKDVPCRDCGAFFPIDEPACPSCGWMNEWLRDGAFTPGSFFFDVGLVDQELRGLAQRQARARELSDVLTTQLLKAPDGFGSDLIGRTINRLAAWMPEALQAEGVPIIEINAFLGSSQARERQFYINNFTAADAAKQRAGVALKAFKKWQKAHKSH